MNEFLEILNNIHGPIRKLDNLGRIVIPKEMRNSLGIDQDDELEVLILDDYIFLKPLNK